MSAKETKNHDNEIDPRASARTAIQHMDEGAAAARSLERLRNSSAEEIAQLAKDGDALRTKMLNESAARWVKRV